MKLLERGRNWEDERKRDGRGERNEEKEVGKRMESGRERVGMWRKEDG